MKRADASPYVPGSLRLDGDDGGPRAQEPTLRCCGYLRRNRAWNFAHVFSSFWRLYYNFSPGHHIVHEGRLIPLHPGRFVLVPENVLFHCRSASGAPDHLYIHFNLSPGQRPLLDAPSVVKADAPGIGMAGELAKAVLGSEAARTGHVAAALLHWILGCLASAAPIARLPSPPLRRALSHIEGHLGGALSNAALAAASGMSVRALIRAFERELHVSPQHHVREIRMREAARRLAQSGDTIEQIAEDLGFPNRFYFTRRFTEHLNCPPAEFRRRHAARQGA